MMYHNEKFIRVGNEILPVSRVKSAIKEDLTIKVIFHEKFCTTTETLVEKIIVENFETAEQCEKRFVELEEKLNGFINLGIC